MLAGAGCPALYARCKPRSYVSHRIAQRCAHDDTTGRYDVDRMRQQLAGQVRVDQRDAYPDTAQPKPDRHVLRTVRHHQADNVASREALCEAPAGVAVTELGQ